MDLETDIDGPHRRIRHDRLRLWLCCAALFACILLFAGLAWQADTMQSFVMERDPVCCRPYQPLDPLPDQAFKTGGPTLLFG